MNVLILTPDAVGSTLLQRTLTIYMTLQQFDRPVINLHELTNGLAKYYSPEFNQEIVSKHTLEKRGYFQTLDEISNMLSSVDHYKTSRLAHYHLVRRNDPIEQQIPFYNYLNDNFFIISCRRDNIFEHALSMTMKDITKKLNVYDPMEKIESFAQYYSDGIIIDTDRFVYQLDAYKKYINWSETYFNISSYFNYERDVPQLEKYILNLPVFSKFKSKITWDSVFDFSFNDWNRMSYYLSDLSIVLNNKSLLESAATSDLLLQYQKHAPLEWPSVHCTDDIANLPMEIKNRLGQIKLSAQAEILLEHSEHKDFLTTHYNSYKKVKSTIEDMQKLGIFISGPPIKKQTLNEKKLIVQNFQQCLDYYNHWCEKNPEFRPQTDSDIGNNIQIETQFWHDTDNNPESKILLTNH